MDRRLYLLFSFSLLFFLFFAQNNYVFAVNNRVEKQCRPGCNGSVLSRNCWEECSELDQDENGNQYCAGIWETKCDSWQISQQCQSWEKCDGQITCYCSGQCLSAPTNVSPGNGEQNLKPPFNIVWNSTPGANSYRYKLEGTNQGTVEGPTANTFYSPETCLLKTNSTHYWQVQACCNADGKNCGSWNEKWSFKTDMSPELSSPKLNTTSTIPVRLDWCDNPEAKAYLIRIYRETGEESFSPIPISKRDGQLSSEYNDTLNFLTKNTDYYWEVATCLNEDGTDCKQSGFQYYSQRWKFETIGSLQATTLISPANDPEGQTPVGLPLNLNWEGIPRSMSYYYYLTPDITGDKFVVVSEANIDYGRLELDKIYKWKIKTCWDYVGKDCEASYSQEWSFRTTGMPPVLTAPNANATGLTIPVHFEWGWNDQKGVPGAKSYVIEISTDEKFSKNILPKDKELVSIPKTNMDYPLLKTSTDYWWRVKTCADDKGEFCGKWSAPQKFKTFKLAAPSSPYPENNGSIYVNSSMGWNNVSGANFYQYKIDFVSMSEEEKSGDCSSKIGQEIISPAITKLSDVSPDLKCLGGYQWTIRSCLDEKCDEAGDWSSLWNFTLSQKIPSGGIGSGIVPCGRNYDDPDTPYNEREQCQFKHLFFSLQNIIDFVLWKVGLIVLVLLALGIGVVYYFSMGAADTIKQANSILKSALKGYIIVFTSWLIINTILTLMGFQVEFFGKWWNISF